MGVVLVAAMLEELVVMVEEVEVEVVEGMVVLVVPAMEVAMGAVLVEAMLGKPEAMVQVEVEAAEVDMVQEVRTEVDMAVEEEPVEGQLVVQVGILEVAAVVLVAVLAEAMVPVVRGMVVVPAVGMAVATVATSHEWHSLLTTNYDL